MVVLPPEKVPPCVGSKPAPTLSPRLRALISVRFPSPMILGIVVIGKSGVVTAGVATGSGGGV